MVFFSENELNNNFKNKQIKKKKFPDKDFM